MKRLLLAAGLCVAFSHPGLAARKEFSAVTFETGSSLTIKTGIAVKFAAGNIINFGATAGAGGYGIRDNGGAIEFKNSGGAWAALGAGGGAGTLTTIKEATVAVGGADIVTLDFGAGFDLTESPDTEINLTLDLSEVLTGSEINMATNALTIAAGITRDAEIDTLTELKTMLTDETTVGWNLLSLTNPSAITFLRINADNTITARSAANMRTDLGVGTIATTSEPLFGDGAGNAVAGVDGTDFIDAGFPGGANELLVSTSTTDAVFSPNPTTTSLTVATEAYDATGWNGDLSVPTKDAVRDKIETLGGFSSTDIDTSAELLAILGDETGTGALVFANTPALVTPNIGAATGTSLVTSGNITATGGTFIAGAQTTALVGSSDRIALNGSTFVEIKAGGTQVGYFQAGGTPEFRFTGASRLSWNSDNTGDIGASGANRPRHIFMGSNGIFGGAIITTPQALSGAGAVNITTSATAFTSTGGAQALTLTDGAAGQIKTISHVVDGGSGVLTPTTKSGYSTITFTNAGDAVTLQYFTTAGWCVTGSYGVTIAP